MALIHPPKWNSAHQPIKYRYTFNSYAFTAVNNNGNGAEIVVGAAVIFFAVGARVYIPSGTYAGTHIVTFINGFGVVLNTAYIANDTGQATPLSNVSATVWAGYAASHDGFATYPLKQLAEITGVPGVNGEIEFDVSGFVKSVFQNIQAPTIGHDFSMSVPFKLVISGEAQVTKYAVNGTFKDSHLAPFDAFYQVLNARWPIHFEDGVCYYSMIFDDEHGPHIFNVIGIEGDGNPGGLGFDAIGTTFTIAA